MRFIEFKAPIVEATLTLSTFEKRNSNYYLNLINLIKKNQPIEVEVKPGKIEQVVFKPSVAVELANIWNPEGKAEEVATAEEVALMKVLSLKTEDGRAFTLSKIVKTPEIVKSLTNENKGIWNKGNIAEGVMASAVSAKFRLEGAPVTFDEIAETIKNIQVELFDVLDKEGKTVTDSEGNIKQTAKGTLATESFGKELSLTISLNKRDFNFFLQSAKNMEDFKKYSNSSDIYKLYEDCANYVNDSDNVTSAVEKIKNASLDDKVNVTADGASAAAQTSTKADLWIAIGQTKERLLSIKTSTVKHIGAASGHQFDNLSEFFKTTLGFGLPEGFREKFMKTPASKKMLDPDDPEKEINNPDYVKMSKAERDALMAEIRKKNYDNAFRESYQWVLEQINRKLAGDSTDGEYDFVKSVSDGVIHHATLGEDVRLVIISPSAKKSYTELEVNDKLHSSLEEYDLIPSIEMGDNYKILIYGYPKTELSRSLKNDKTLFVQLRSYMQDKAVRNVVEIGGLLKNLTEVERIRDDTGEEDVVKVQDQKASVDISNMIHAIIVRNQLPLEKEPEILAQANELLKAGYNYNQIADEIIAQYSQAEPEQSVEPAQQPVEPRQQEPVQQQPVQQKQKLGHLRQGPEQQSEPTEPVNQEPNDQQKIKESDDQVLSMIRGITKCVFMK
jgi:hypothetical protein